MNIIVIGCGGIGSFLAEHLYKQIRIGQVFVEVFLADRDIVELNQIKYQNFGKEEIGKSKAYTLANRYEFNPIMKRIEKGFQLKGYDLIVLAVDNGRTRQFVVDWSHTNKIDFIDLRSTGRNIFAMPKGKNLFDNMKFVEDDGKEYSCQDKGDLEKGHVQMGNQIVAAIGCQMILNYCRGHDNKIMSLVV